MYVNLHSRGPVAHTGPVAPQAGRRSRVVPAVYDELSSESLQLETQLHRPRDGYEGGKLTAPPLLHTGRDKSSRRIVCVVCMAMGAQQTDGAMQKQFIDDIERLREARVG
eukprot:765985-Hanusia_phi.AAC.2